MSIKVAVKFKSTTGINKKKARSLQELDGESVEIGWFEEQGQHSTGRSYPEIMRYHARALPEEGAFIKRDPKKVVEVFHKPSKEQKIFEIISDKLENLDKSNEQVLDSIGRHYTALLASKMGLPVPGLNPASPGNPDPMLDTGETKDKTSYKTSLNPKLRK